MVGGPHRDQIWYIHSRCKTKDMPNDRSLGGRHSPSRASARLAAIYRCAINKDGVEQEIASDTSICREEPFVDGWLRVDDDTVTT